MRYNNIQVLRLATAVAVVLAHLGYYAQHVFGTTAFPAVPLWAGAWKSFLAPTFFAVSGFVLTQAIGSVSPSRFLLARAVRLYPGYWLAALLVMGLMWFTVWPPEFRRYVRPENVSWLLLPRPAGTAIYPLGVEWTLVYEIALYLWMAAVVTLFGAKRGLPVAAAVWAAALVVKAAVWPGYGSVTLPSWAEFPFSLANLAFLLGVLVYQVRERGRRWRWAVLAGLVAYLAVVPGRAESFEGQWLVFAPAAAVLVWLVAQFPQASATNRFVRAGEYSYGVYVMHAPIMSGTFYLLLSQGWLLDSTAAVLLAGAAALCGGLLCGWLEFRLHTRIRPLLRIDYVAKAQRLGRLAARLRPRSVAGR